MSDQVGNPEDRFSRNEAQIINPNKSSGLSHPYHLTESILILGTSGVFFILFHFSMKSMENRIAPAGTPRFAASHLGFFCPIKRMLGLYELKQLFSTSFQHIQIQIQTSLFSIKHLQKCL